MITLENITKIYHLEEQEIPALRGVSLHIAAGEMVAIVGSSGSGKSTLMHVLGCLDSPNSGNYFLNGQNVAGLSTNRLAEVRNRQIGFVFQSFNLLPRLNALENVELPLLYRHSARGARAKAADMLARLGLGDRLHHRPSQLSGGQNQRVAVARALVTDPAILLADEPTGNLDSATSHEIMNLMLRLNKDEGRTVLVVTHETDVAEYCPRKIHLRDGQVT
ncbi:MAG: ABC transporter ATP-binding protein [Planctomycetaceae bacterium]|nr:ABC transporter ATP-binding protein [Planctomycetaceae bacterium]